MGNDALKNGLKYWGLTFFRQMHIPLRVKLSPWKQHETTIREHHGDEKSLVSSFFPSNMANSSVASPRSSLSASIVSWIGAKRGYRVHVFIVYGSWVPFLDPLKFTSHWSKLMFLWLNPFVGQGHCPHRAEGDALRTWTRAVECYHEVYSFSYWRNKCRGHVLYYNILTWQTRC